MCKQFIKIETEETPEKLDPKNEILPDFEINHLISTSC